MSVDGFVAGPSGEMDWMTLSMDDEKLQAYVNALTDSSDTILLGRKMTDGFVTYWTSAASDSQNPQYLFAQKMVNTPKVVFTKTLRESNWANTTLATGDLVEEIEALKQKAGRDIIVYGGATFVSNLIKENLIDEYHLSVNPTAIGCGMTIFGDLKDRLKLKLVQSNVFSHGKIVNHYEPER